MATRRINPHRAKLNICYDVTELAACFGVHKNTVRHWQRAGLEPIDKTRPVLFRGDTVRAFHAKRNASRKRPCAPGMLFCLSCRVPRPPALGMLDYQPKNFTSGNIRALCAACSTVMYRAARKSTLHLIMPGCDVQFMEAPSRISGRFPTSLNCDSKRQTKT